MKTNPGGNLDAAAVIGRETEIAEAWRTLDSQSIVLTSERRIGKTCLLRKMVANPPEGWLPLMCWVESKRHPNEVVQDLYVEAEKLGLRSGREVWSRRLRTAYEAASGANFGNWHLPQFQPDWKRLCNTLFDDLADTDQRVLIVMDEFPHLVANMMAGDAATAMEFLDLMREVRQRLEPAGGIRFVFAGSVGLHLIIEQLKAVHGYRSNPTNDMAAVPLSGMSLGDTKSMCRAFLDEEGIRRDPASDFDRRMFEATDGLPIYIQHVCQKFQTARPQSVAPSDIDEVLDDMLDGSEVEWFADSAKRIETHYRDLGATRLAFAILDLLCRETRFVPELEIADFVRSQMVVEDDRATLSALELLQKDQYIARDTSDGVRRYRFKYELMRRWWDKNKGSA